jgi:beta-lactamase family protein
VSNRSPACVVLTAVLTVIAAGCVSCATPPPVVSLVPRSGCAAPQTSGVDTAQAWMGYVGAHRGDVGLAVDDGRGARVVLRPDAQQPLASAAKVVHLAAYGRAVAEGKVRTDDPVRVGDWERWYLPGSDGGAHPKALDRAGVANDGMRALDPQRTVSLDTIVAAMIQVSDNAAADFLRDRLGDQALSRAAADGGWANVDLPSFLGEILALLAPELVQASAPRAQRAAAELALAQRFATEFPLRTELSTRPLPPITVQQRWAEETATGSANQLAALHRAITTGAFGPGADIARRQLEWQKVILPNVVGVGFKGGSLPGVLTEAFTVRREDGSTATGTLLVRGMPAGDWFGALTSFAHQQMLLAAMTDSGATARLSCSV